MRNSSENIPANTSGTTDNGRRNLMEISRLQNGINTTRGINSKPPLVISEHTSSNKIEVAKINTDSGIEFWRTLAANNCYKKSIRDNSKEEESVCLV